MQTLFYSCLPGYNLLPLGSVKNFKREFIDMFHLKSTTHFNYKILSWRNIPYHEKIRIESLFAKYGIDKERIWLVTDHRIPNRQSLN